jgi:hypothetical protein
MLLLIPGINCLSSSTLFIYSTFQADKNCSTIRAKNDKYSFSEADIVLSLSTI